MTKKLIAFLAAIFCGFASFAATEVKATFASLENGAKSGDYTVSGNCISGGTAWAYTDYITVIVKYTGLPSTGKQAIATIHQSNNDNKVGVYVDGRVVKGIWQGNEWNNVTGQSLEENGTIVLVYAPSSSSGTTVYDASGTAVYTASALKDSTNSFGDKINFGAKHDGSMKLDGFSVDALQILKGAAQASEITTLVAAFEEAVKPVVPAVEPVALFNFGYTTEEAGWYNYNQNGGNNIGPITTNGVSFTATKSNGNFFYTTNEDFAEVNTDFTDNGTYADILGVDHATLQEEVKTSLGLTDVDFTTAVYKSGQMNGGQTDHAVSVSGLDANTKYVLYAGFGLFRTKYNAQVMGVQFNDSGYVAADALEYVTTVAGQNTTVATQYQTFTAGSVLTCGSQGLMVIRLKNVTPKTDGSISFTFKGDKGGINFLAVAKVNESKPTSKTFDISGNVSYGELETEGLTRVTLNLTADATVTFTEAVSAALTFTGSHNLTVKGGEHLTIANVADSGVTGNITYEFGGTYTAADGLKNKIKAASTKYKFVFTGNATVDFTSANLGTINTHLVFSGDTSTLKITNGNSKFAASATYDNPTILVERGTLTFYGHDVTGWAAGTDANGIIRVKNGATLQLENYGTGTFYYNQRIAIDAGATVNVGNSLSGNQFRMTEGVNGQQIWVQDCASDMSATPAKLVIASSLALAKDGSAQGIGVYVGANAKLQISGTINSLDANNNLNNATARTIKKTGAGVLEVSGTHGVTYEVAAGSIGGNATVQKLNLVSGTSLVLSDNKSLTVQAALTLVNPINLVCTPVHGMTVLTPPSGFEGAGYKATLNGAANEYDLYLEDGALKLKYKTPPSFPEDIGDFVIEVKSGKVGEITIDVSKLDLHDYATDSGVSYKLDFGGDKVVVGTRTDNTVTFDLAAGDFLSEHVYRGDFVVEFPDGELKNPIAVYEGVRTPTWIADALVIREKGTINDARGETIKLEEEESILNHDPDYIDNCDSVYMVTLSASEAVDAEADADLVGDEQGGVRIAQTSDGLKLQVLTKTGDDDPTWTDLAPATVGMEYVVKVQFHYSKSEDDEATGVTYTVANAEPQTSVNPTSKLKVTEVFIADGTVLPNDLTGLFQLDSAVVADVEIVIDHDETAEIEAENLADAQKLADKMVVAISEEVAKVVSAETYRGYFKVVAKQGADNKFHAVVEFAPGIQEEIEDDIEDAIEQVVSGFSSGSAQIAAKPGLYYGVKRGDALDNLDIEETTLATSDKVTITITKPEGASAHFYRIIVSPTPATK